jgi:hypothetical protein
MNDFEPIIKNAEKRLYYLYRYRDIASVIKEKVLEYFANARVLVFGSIIKGEVTADSDIDLLIIINERDYAKEAEFRADIIRSMFDIPLELHFASKDQFENWYKKFIDIYEEVI